MYIAAQFVYKSQIPHFSPSANPHGHSPRSTSEMRSSSPSSSSDSCGTTPSTAPSSPPPESSSYFLVLHDATTAFLDALPVGKATGDLILYFRGSGAVKGLLSQAADALQDKTILDVARWERVSAKDGEVEVTYYRTKADIATVDTECSAPLDSIRCDTQSVGALHTASYSSQCN